MPYVLGLIVVAFLLTYPIGRWQRRRLRQHPEEIVPGDTDTGAGRGDLNPIALEAVLRDQGGHAGGGPR